MKEMTNAQFYAFFRCIDICVQDICVLDKTVRNDKIVPDIYVPDKIVRNGFAKLISLI